MTFRINYLSVNTSLIDDRMPTPETMKQLFGGIHLV